MKKVAAVCLTLAMLAGLCILPAGAADTAFSVRDQNGYTGFVAFEDFEKGAVAGEIFEQKNANGDKYNPVIVTQGPGDAVGAENHHNVAFVPTNPASTTPSGERSDQFIRIKYQAVDPYYDAGTNPDTKFRERFQQVKLELDLLYKDFLGGNINFVDYDCENEQGKGTRPSVDLIEFYSDGTFTMRDGDNRSEPVAYETNHWYHYTFYLDFATGTYTAYQDETCLADELRFYSDPSINGIAPIGFTVYINGTDMDSGVYLDNMGYSIVPNYNRTMNEVKTVAADAFENGVPSSNVFNSKGAIESVTSETDAEAHGKVIRMHNRDASGAVTDSFFRTQYKNLYGTDGNSPLTGEELENAKQALFDIDILLSDYMAASLSYVDFGEDNSRQIPTLVSINQAGFFVFNTREGNPRRMRYEPDTWYSFRFYVNFETQTYTACVNGRIVTEDASLQLAGNRDSSYALTFQLQLNRSGNQPDFYADMDNYSYMLVDCEKTPRLSKTQQGEGQFKLSYVPEQAGTMIAAVYDGSRLTHVDTYLAEANAYHLVNYHVQDGQTPRLFWWNTIDGMTPLDGLPGFPDDQAQ